MLTGLSLFSGIGGIDVALSDWVKPAAYCEIEPYCQTILLQRMQEGLLFPAPIWDDITTLTYKAIQEIIHYDVDIIFGGFPCQDISIAGNGKGLAGERSGLFFEIVRLAKEIKPKFIFLENVPAITSRGGLQVVKEVAEMGYDCRWCVISASSVGALHRRERWFLLAYANSERLDEISRGITSRLQTEYSESSDCNIKDEFCNTDSKPSKQADISPSSICSMRQSWRNTSAEYWPFESRNDWQEAVSRLGKCIDGLSAKLDYNTERLRCLGNAVVPQQVRKAFEILMGLKIK